MDALKSMIREKLRESPLVSKVLDERPDFQEDPAGLLQHLEDRGLVEDIFASLENTLSNRQAHDIYDNAETVQAEAGVQLMDQAPGVWQLSLKLIEGQAFLDFLDVSEASGR